MARRFLLYPPLHDEKHPQGPISPIGPIFVPSFESFRFRSPNLPAPAPSCLPLLPRASPARGPWLACCRPRGYFALAQYPAWVAPALSVWYRVMLGWIPWRPPL